MAIGDEASDAGYPLVPNTGEEGKVRYGAREINRTRDFVARISKYGTADPNNNDGRPNGSFYYKII